MLIHVLRRTAIVLAITTTAAGCSGGSGSMPASGVVAGPSASRSTTRSSVPDSASPDASQKVFVASRDSDSVLAFAVTADGNVSPVRNISGPNTMLGFPVSLSFSPSGHLDVVNDSGTEVLIFPKGANGNATPSVLGGSNVPITAAEGVAVAASGEIYVSDFRANKIFVFKAGATGNVAPKRTISGAKTLLDSPAEMAFDSAGRLYVANYLSSTGAILEFASNAHGNVAPIAKLGGSHTKLGGINSVCIDSSDRILASGSGSTSVEIFAAGAHGNVAPAATISGSATLLTYVIGTGVDSSGHIYVTNRGATPSQDAILIFASGAHGNVAPTADITGSNTGIDTAFTPVVR